MEEFSYRQSPREFLLSRNTEATPPRLNDSYRKCSYGSALQKENIALAVTTLFCFQDIYYRN